ncbi:MAG TPA: hypothetical protein VM534_08190 [Thermoanaerobaculia bacterium]|nr:hypothetical protein [Thermoanaerobaculia bacterium]
MLHAAIDSGELVPLVVCDGSDSAEPGDSFVSGLLIGRSREDVILRDQDLVSRLTLTR